LRKFIHKAVSLIVIAWGVMFVVVSVQMAVDMFGDPELTLGGALFLSLLAFGISFAILYVGWRMWKSDKR
jgi:divalent metal cation (Fe/Co/Zn/Cd) transporter